MHLQDKPQSPQAPLSSGSSAVGHCASRRLRPPPPTNAERYFHIDVKVYGNVIIRIRLELKAERSVGGCSLQTPSTVNM